MLWFSWNITFVVRVCACRIFADKMVSLNGVYGDALITNAYYYTYITNRWTDKRLNWNALTNSILPHNIKKVDQTHPIGKISAIFYAVLSPTCIHALNDIKSFDGTEIYILSWDLNGSAQFLDIFLQFSLSIHFWRRKMWEKSLLRFTNRLTAINDWLYISNICHATAHIDHTHS